MPEGDTVWRQARSLHRALAGRTVHSSSLRFPNVADTDLSGMPIHGALARGKHLMIRIGNYSLHSHLKMEGIWHLYGLNEQGHPQKWKRNAIHARAVLNANSRLDTHHRVIPNSTPITAVGFNLGLLEIIPTAQEKTRLDHLGPDILGADWDLELAVANLKKRPDRLIGPALLDQKNLAGIGTIYRAETLFLSGIDPRCPVSQVPELERVIETAYLLLNANKMRPLRITRTPQEPLWCYGRTGRACYRCGSTIIREELSDQGTDHERFGTNPHAIERQEDISRLSYRCPTCQVI